MAEKLYSTNIHHKLHKRSLQRYYKSSWNSFLFHPRNKAINSRFRVIFRNDVKTPIMGVLYCRRKKYESIKPRNQGRKVDLII